MWNTEDSNMARKIYFAKNMKPNEKNTYKKTKQSIRRKFDEVYIKFLENMNTIKMAAEIIVQDEYTEDIEDQLIFFDLFFEFFKIYAAGSYFNYKSKSYAIMHFYGTLPLRMNVFMNEFQIVDRFKTLKIFFEYAYLINFNETDKNRIKRSFSEIYDGLYIFYNNLEKLCKECLLIIDIMEKLIYT
ncbi:uncharacterized protein VNE69_06022 [Vairimorpha necatrix]